MRLAVVVLCAALFAVSAPVAADDPAAPGLVAVEMPDGSTLWTRVATPKQIKAGKASGPGPLSILYRRDRPVLCVRKGGTPFDHRGAYQTVTGVDRAGWLCAGVDV